MAKYRNKSGRDIVIQGQAGRMVTIGPNQIVELSHGIASRGFPYLVKEDERQILIESPISTLEVQKEPKEEPVVEEKKTVEIDVDGDGKPDVEVKGEVVEDQPEEEEPKEEPKTKPKTKSSKQKKKSTSK